MTTPRPHSELATLYFSDSTLKCWVRNKNINEDWSPIRDPNFYSNTLEYYVGHEPPPPIKRTITLIVNGKEWVLPEIFRDEPEEGTIYWTDTPAGATKYTWRGDVVDKVCFMHQRVHASQSDAQAWADFDKWCRGGGA